MIAVVLPLMLSFFQRDSLKEKKMPAEDTLQLGLMVPPRVVAGSEKVTATLTLSNAGTSDLWVNARMLLNSAHAPAAARELWLEIEGPRSRKIEFECKVRAGAAGPEDYVALHPRQKREIQVNLLDCFDLHDAGRYVLRAYYQDGNTSVPRPPNGADHPSYRVRSNSVSVEIVGEKAPVA